MARRTPARRAELIGPPAMELPRAACARPARPSSRRRPSGPASASARRRAARTTWAWPSSSSSTRTRPVPGSGSALEIDPGLAIAQVNLAIALLNVPDLEGARREAALAAEPAPRAAAGALRARASSPRARTGPRTPSPPSSTVLALDPADVGALVNLASSSSSSGATRRPIADFREALAAEPYNAHRRSTTSASPSPASGQREEGQKTLERFQELRDKGYGTVDRHRLPRAGPLRGGGGHHRRGTGARGSKAPDVKFVEAGTLDGAGAEASTFGRRLRRSELRDDVKRQLVSASGAAPRSSISTGTGRSTSTTPVRRASGCIGTTTADSPTHPDAGLDLTAAGVGAVAGDYDNDGRPDLFVSEPAAVACSETKGAVSRT